MRLMIWISTKFVQTRCSVSTIALPIDRLFLPTSFIFSSPIADFNDTVEQAINSDNQGTNPVIRATAGRLTGNFKIDKDMKSASAYAFVTTNAAVGTNQDGSTYWKKIRDSFIQRRELASRTLVSMKDQFNNVLQAKVNKDVGCTVHFANSIVVGGRWTTTQQRRRPTSRKSKERYLSTTLCTTFSGGLCQSMKFTPPPQGTCSGLRCNSRRCKIPCCKNHCLVECWCLQCWQHWSGTRCDCCRSYLWCSWSC